MSPNSMAEAVTFAHRMSPRQVIPIHDFYLSSAGREFVIRLADIGLGDTDIEVVPLDWGDHYTV